MPFVSRSSARWNEILFELWPVTRSAALQELPVASPARREILCYVRHRGVIQWSHSKEVELMRRVNYRLVNLALFTAAQIATLNVQAYRAQDTQQSPQVTSARLKGNKLIVSGANFSEGAVIFVQGEPVGTRSDSDNPSGVLIAKKAGKRIPPETIVSVAVRNNSGAMSQPLEIFAGLVITFDDNGGSFGLG